jgi:hypothetical protein
MGKKGDFKGGEREEARGKTLVETVHNVENVAEAPCGHFWCSIFACYERPYHAELFEPVQCGLKHGESYPEKLAAIRSL